MRAKKIGTMEEFARAVGPVAPDGVEVLSRPGIGARQDARQDRGGSQAVGLSPQHLRRQPQPAAHQDDRADRAGPDRSVLHDAGAAHRDGGDRGRLPGAGAELERPPGGRGARHRDDHRTERRRRHHRAARRDVAARQAEGAGQGNPADLRRCAARRGRRTVRRHQQPPEHSADHRISVPLRRRSDLFRHAEDQQQSPSTGATPMSPRWSGSTWSRASPARRRRATGISNGRPSTRPRASCATAAFRRARCCAPTTASPSACWRPCTRPGLKVGFGPDCDFRVAGHDNQRLSAYTCPPLTTVSQDCDEMGRDRARHAVCQDRQWRLAGRGNAGNERVLLDAALVLRKSA